MIRLTIDGETFDYVSLKSAHDDIVDPMDCDCHCRLCSEADCWDCLVSTLDQRHKWSMEKDKVFPTRL